MFDVGGGELILILLVIVVLFGPKNLPELARSMGKGIAMFKKAQMQFQAQIDDIKQEITAPLEEVKREIDKNVTEELAKDVTPKSESEIKPIEEEAKPSIKEEILPEEPFADKIKSSEKIKNTKDEDSLSIN